ncbi:MAG: PorV/PorQ family protein [Candidatus Latescibacterota bacterium]
MTGKTAKATERRDRRRRPKFVLVLAAALMISATAAQGAFFDTAGKSARPMGMGEVFLATSGEASSYWYNPAGLSMVKNRQVGLTYGLPVAAVSELSISQLNFATPLGGNGGLGIGLSYGGVDVANDMVLSGGYGVRIGERLALGGNVKILRWAIEGQPDLYNGGVDDDLSKVSFSLDLSASYGLGEVFGLGNFTTGVYVKDAIMPNISESGDDGGKLPIEFGVGLMMERSGVLAEADIVQADGNTFFRLGAETGVSGSNLKLRGGFDYGRSFGSDSELTQTTRGTDISLGLGYSFSSLVFNYAFNLPFEIKNTDGKHFISFGVSF